jgi:hypothetical protein
MEMQGTLIGTLDGIYKVYFERLVRRQIRGVSWVVPCSGGVI